jgi:hypothetical protein
MRNLAFTLSFGLLALGIACSGSELRSTDAAVDARVTHDATLGTSKRDSGDDTDAGAALGPRGGVRGRVDGVDAADSRSGVVSVAGSSRALGSSYFTLDEVPAGAAVSVFVRVPGYSLGHAQVAIQEDRTTAVLLEVVKLTTQAVADPNAEQQLTFGPEEARHTLGLPKGALVPVYGTAPGGAATFAAAALNAKNAPGGMWVEDGGTRFRFRSLAMVELRAAQPGAALSLKLDANLTLHIANSSQAKLQVYRFDESTGVWLKHALADHDAATRSLSVSIARFGVYAVGEPLTQLGCVSLGVTDGAGKGVPGAALRYSDEAGTEGTQVWTDESGRACLPASTGAMLTYAALGQATQRLLSSAGQLTSSSAAASCGAECADGGLSIASPAPVRCVRGQIAANGVNASVALWTGGASGTETKAGQVYPGHDFCVDISTESQIRFASTLRCGEPRPLPRGDDVAASCGQDGCLDLGTINCCADSETCGNSIDDDCDQRVDEGCRCGSNDCAAARATRSGGDYCCTDEGLCGMRDRINKVDKNRCFDLQTKSRPDSTQCGDEVLDLGSGKQAVPGCCRADQHCGLKLQPLECAARADAKYFVASDAPALADKTCAY